VSAETDRVERGGSRIGPAPALEIASISKSFPETRALSDVSMTFLRGSVTALLGQNGSGKSTLVKILAGFHGPDPESGRIVVGEETLALPIAPSAAHSHGLRFVHQDMALVDELTVADNFAFAQGFGAATALSPIRDRRLLAQVERSLAELGVQVSAAARVADIAPAERMMVAIARAFADSEGTGGSAGSNRIIFLDEPTAFLPSDSVEQVHRLVGRIRDAGGTVVYITHRLDEVVEIADRLVVLRDGAVTAEREVGSATEAEIAELVVGAAVRRERLRRQEGQLAGEPLLEVDALSGPRLRGIKFTIHRGEVLGVAGLVGCGRSELTRIIAGAQRASGGILRLDGAEYSPSSPREAIRRGVAFVPPDRRGQGLVAEMTFRENVTLGDLSPYTSTVGAISTRKEKGDVERLIEVFRVSPKAPERMMAEFSGGNQQKGILAKFSRLKPRLLVVDEPTQGVDIGGKQEIGAVLRRFADEGGSVLLASSDLDEVTQFCDRVLILDRGEQRGIIDAGEITEQSLTAHGVEALIDV